MISLDTEKYEELTGIRYGPSLNISLTTFYEGVFEAGFFTGACGFGCEESFDRSAALLEAK